jgi:DNA-binding NarL/FixJ family response regulator
LKFGRGRREKMMATNEVASETRTPTAERTVNLLIVEDEALVASYIQDVLEESGFIISGVASTGPEALSLATGTPVDLALVDIKLAGPMDGIEVARILLERHAVPSIFLSGMHDPETTRRAQAIGPLGFLQKPFRPSQVFNALEKARARLTQS